MEEEKLLLLASQGYTYDDAGFITDSNGSFIDKVSIDGEEFNSILTLDDFNHEQTRRKELDDLGFTPDSNISKSVYRQGEEFAAKKYIEDFSKNPDKTPLKRNSYSDVVFEQLKEEGLVTDDSLDIFEKNLNEFSDDPTISALREVAPENINDLKEVRSGIEAIKSKDADVDTIMEDILQEERDPDRNIFTKAGDKIFDTVYKAISLFTPTGTGMDNEELKETYKGLIKREKELIEPAILLNKDKISSRKEELKNIIDNLDFTDRWSLSDETGYLIYEYNELDKEEAALDSYLQGDYAYNPFNTHDATDLLSAGFAGAFETWRYRTRLTNKLNNGEKLTEKEQNILKSLDLINQTKNIGYKQNASYDIINGTVESGKFLAGGVGGRMVGKAASTAIAKGVANPLLGRGLGILADQGIQVALHSQTYDNAFDKYAGNVTIVPEEDGSTGFYTEKRLYNTLTTEADNNILAITEKIEDLKRTQANPEEIARWELEREKTLEYKNSIKENPSVMDAALYGVTEVLKENLAEKYAGKLLNNKLTKGISNSKLGRAIANSPINTFGSKAKNLFNKQFGGVPGEKVLGSNLEEIWEEVLVQATPTYGQTGEEYKQQVGELLEADFYTKVVGQTLLMSGTMKGAVGAYNKVTEGKDIKQKRDYFKKIYKELENSKVSQSEFNQLLMKTGEGKYSVQEYNNEIQNLRNAGKDSEASEIEQNKFFNMAMVAVKNGQGSQFKKSLQKARFNENLDPATIANIQSVIAEVDGITNDLGEVETYKNKEVVVDLMSKKRYTKNQKETINKKIDALKADTDSKGELSTKTKKEIEVLESHLPTVEKALKQLDSKIDQETSYKTQRKLMLQEDLSSEINEINKQVYEGGMSLNEIEAIDEKLYPKYKSKLSKEDFNEVINQFKTATTLKNVIEKKKEAANIEEKVEVPQENPEPVFQDPDFVEPTPLDNSALEFLGNTLELETQTVSETAKPKAAPTQEQEFDFLLPNEEGNYDEQALNQMAESAKKVASDFKKEFKREPNFKDFVESLLSRVNNDKQAIKDHFQSIGLSWEQAGLGNSNWKSLYNDYYVDMHKSLDAFLNVTGVTHTPITQERIAEKVEDSEQEIENNSLASPVGVNPLTGAPIKKTINKGKTFITDHKANYSAIEYNLVKTKTADGTIISYENADTPVLSEQNYIDFKHLVNPNKNNIGDKLTAYQVGIEEWDEVKVARRKANGEVLDYISFSDWVSSSKPSETSLEEFMKSDTFIEKVPMAYKDSQGNPVAFVPEVAWYNPFTVGDSSKGSNEEINLDNPSPTQKATIQENKKKTKELRKQIISGQVKEVQITDNTSFPFIKIASQNSEGQTVPLKTLEEVAPDSQVVFFTNNGTILDLDKNAIDKSQIINLSSISGKQEISDNSGMVSTKFENAGKSMYLSHVTTVDGVKKYVALNVLRKDENNKDQVNNSDLQTVQWALAAHNVLYFKDKDGGSSILKNENHTHYLDAAQAENIRNQVKDITGLDLVNRNDVDKIANAILALNKNGKLDASIKGITKEIYNPQANFIQNTSLSYGKKPMISISKNDAGQLTVDTVADSYDKYLKKRLSTNIMGYNVGTAQNPVYTPAVQQTVILTPIVNELEQTVEEVVEEAKSLPEVNLVTQEIVNENPKVSKIDLEKREEIIKDAVALAKSLNLDLDNLQDFDDLLVPTLDETENIENSIQTTPGLIINQEHDIIDYLVSLLSKKDIQPKEVKEIFSKAYQQKLNAIEEQVSNLREIYNQDPTNNKKVGTLISKLKEASGQVEIVLENYNTLLGKASEVAQRSSFITDDFKTEDEVIIEEKDFSRSAAESSPIDKVGTALKRIYARIPNGTTGFLGTPKFDSFKSMYDISLSLLTSDVHKASDFNSMMDKLSTYSEAYDWIEPLVKELKNSPSNVKNQFTYNAYKQAVKAKFAVVTTTNTKGINSGLWDSNANDAERVIQNKWRNNFKRSSITNKDKISTDKLKNLASTWTSWGANPSTQSDSVLRNWLGDFGISVSDKTWQAIKKGELYTRQNKKLTQTPFENLFMGSGDQRGPNLFFSLAKYAFQNKDKNDFDFIENANNHPFKDMNEILKQLSKLEARYNPNYISSTRRVGGKTLSEIESMTYFYEQSNKLKNSALTDKKYLEDLTDLSFSSNSMLLDLLKTDENFAQNFESSFLDIVSLKELYKKTPMFGGIDELSNVDYMFVQRAMLQNRNQGTIQSKYKGFDLRFGHISTPTNSDKGRMMLLKTAILDLYANSETAFTRGEDGDFKFSKDLKEVLYTQLVEPEIKRALNAKETNIKGYNKGAKRVNLIPGVNNLKSQDGISVISALGSGVAGYKADNFKEDYFDVITNFIEDNIKKEASNNIKTLNQFNDGKVDGFNNEEYLSRRQGSIEENMYVAELDYLINSMIGNSNTFQAIAGDPAIYYKSKEDINSTSDAVQEKISIELGINLGKRLAAMIAPGDPLADSKGNKYLQIFMEDPEEVAQNAKDIVEWHYGKPALKELFEDKTYSQHIEDLQKGVAPKNVVKQLETRFAKVRDFFNIESADAQEYSTTKEHIYVLNKQGRLSPENYKKITEKIENQKKSERKGEKYNTSDLLTKEELDLVLQPIKPVYTGSIIDKNQDVNRMMYIKSSSFPLIPQLTTGRGLDNLRKKMEELEDTYKTTVRASYQTANKVGALTSPINPFDQNSLDTLDERDSEGNALHHIELDRENFKIQQDVPFKSKKVQDDTVSMGTQIFKLLFGDGVMDLDGFNLDGEQLNGRELKEKFFDAFSHIVDVKKSKLLSKLGLDENMESTDKEKTAKAFQKMVIDEAKSRGFSDQDMKALTLEERTNSQGEKYYHFKLPLWFSANSNKYESMFNAIINNKIFKQKVPGNSFVTGSEAGFEMTDDLSNIDKSRVIHLNGYAGTELKGTNNSEGGISKAEILVPSKFKLGGKLVDLFENFNGETGKYLERNEQGILVIKEGMIDKELLNQFVFRIPTSSHGLGSSVEIVGFLPPENGDLVITPKNFITQMGQDFDIDKLTAYQYNHLVMPNGQIKLLNEENKNEFLKAQKEILDDLETQILQEQKYGEFADQFLSLFPDASFPNTYNEQEIKEEIVKVKKQLNQDFEIKLAENNFVKIHNTVYSNPKMQPYINKVLSMEFAEGQADGIEALTSKKENSFNILSPNYQMKKMNLGSTGKVAIGIYAKGVTFHSIVQQADAKIQLTMPVEEGVEPKTIRIGKIVSDGSFGRSMTITKENSTEIEKKLNRRISSSLDERTNTGTDNEKAQILGRVGLNFKDGIAVDSLLATLGIDAEVNIISKEEYDNKNPFHKEAYIDGQTVYYTEHSIPYLLHSQPIIKEYFNRVSVEESITTKFTKDLKNKVVSDLLKELVGENYMAQSGNLINMSSVQSEQDNTKFTASNLVNEIEVGGSPKFQAQVLALYLDLIEEAKKTKKLMSIIDMDNLGKSMWESSLKAQEFRSLLTDPDFGISNVNSLVGTYKTGATPSEGEVSLGDGLLFKPTTNQGKLVGTALSLSENLFNDYFPAKNEYINAVINNIIDESGVNTDNVFALTKAKEGIFQEIKKYITSAKHNGIFSKQAKEVRQSLYIDTPSNTSLSSYIGDLFVSNNSEFSKGIKTIKNNRFLSIMNYEKGESGKPSLIKFNNAEAMEISQEYIYNAFKELILNDQPLPSKNGEAYSTRQLAQELVAYSFSGGGIIQGAIEFHKFIPLEYLDDLSTFNKNGNKVPVTKLLQHYDTQNSDWSAINSQGKQRLSDFTKQYFQNNPEEAKQFTKKELKDTALFPTDNIMVVNDPLVNNEFISVKQSTKGKLKQEKWNLYQRVGNGKYHKIDVLGETGMSEYEYGNENLSSSIKTEKTIPVDTQHDLRLIANEVSKEDFSIEQGADVKGVLDRIALTNFGDNKYINDVAESLKPFVNGNTQILMEDDKNLNFAGRRSFIETKDGKIEIIRLNKAAFGKNKKDLAQTFLHEFVHTLTSSEINKSLDAEGNLLPGSTKEIIGLNRVYNEYVKNLKNSYSEEYEEFNKKWKTYNENKTRENKDKIPVSFTTREIEVFYPSVNLKEFVATALGNNNTFIQEAKEMPYLKSGLNILDKFGKFIVDLLNKIKSTSSIEANLAEEAIVKSLSFIESVNKKVNTNTNNIEQELSDSELIELEIQEKEDQMSKYFEGFSKENKNKPDNLPPIGRSSKKCN